jgi:hypothetical protein
MSKASYGKYLEGSDSLFDNRWYFPIGGEKATNEIKIYNLNLVHCIHIRLLHFHASVYRNSKAFLMDRIHFT